MWVAEEEYRASKITELHKKIFIYSYHLKKKITIAECPRTLASCSTYIYRKVNPSSNINLFSSRKLEKKKSK